MAALDVDAARARALAFVKGFSPSQLVIIGLLTVVSVVAALSFLRWVTAPTYGMLLGGMDAEDAAAVTAELDAAGVPYQLEGGGTTVLVPNDVVDEQRLALAAAGLPKGETADGWGIVDAGNSMTTSSFQQRIAFQRAMQGELESAVEGIDGIREATVNLALPEEKLFTDQAEPARASVLVQAAGTLPDETVDAITHLVASAVPGLAPSAVSITDGSGALLTGQGASAAGDRAAKQRQALEDQLSGRVTTMFDTLLGPGRAVVRVSAEMDQSNRTIDSEVYDPDRTAVLSSSNSEEVYETGPEGEVVNGVITTEPGAAEVEGQAGGGYTKTQESVQNGVSRTVERQVLGPGGIKRLSVAVAIDRNAANAPTPAEVQALAANAVGLDPARGDTIAVTTPAFPIPDEQAAEAAAETGGGVRSTTELAATVLGGVLLLLVGLGLLRTVRRGTSTDIPLTEVTAVLEGGGKRKKGAVGAAAQTALPAGAVPGPRSEVSVLATVEENPDEVADMLRGWLASAGDR